MDKKTEQKPRKKGFFAILKESITKTSEGCGPECGCHTAVEKDKVKVNENVKDSKNK